MLASRPLRVAARAAGAGGVLGSGTAQAATIPPPPASTVGKTIHSIGTAQTPTSWGFLGRQAFVGAFGDEENNGAGGGLYYVKGAQATLVPGADGPTFGVTTHRRTLYTSSVSFGPQGPVSAITRWRGWNGSAFAHHKVIWTSPKNFSNLNGLEWVRGRIYAGVGLSDNNDHGPPQTKHEYQVISVKANGTGLKVVAKGIAPAVPVHVRGPAALPAGLGARPGRAEKHQGAGL